MDPTIPNSSRVPRLPPCGAAYFEENLHENLIGLIVCSGLMKILGLPLVYNHISVSAEIARSSAKINVIMKCRSNARVFN
jgi:hypothetical protein